MKGYNETKCKAITRMLFILTTLCGISVLISAIMMCLCWRKRSEKNDLLGLEGLVTQKNPDENVNHLPSAIQTVVPDGTVLTQQDDSVTDTKRPVAVNNPRRSLPDIPFDGLRNYGDGVAYEPGGDNSSDLYATVEPYQNASAKRHTLPNGIESRPSLSQHSSLSQADDTFSPYARVKEHPYDKLREAEHPYAQVQPSCSSTTAQEDVAPGPSGIRKERTTLQTIGESVPRSRRSSNQSVSADIPAASAVAGGVAASQELPYMTPPIAQTNFSGDSQDSSRGYTSITVREPLADIRAQTKLLNRRDLDPHYSTVSDDSDDVYTTIHDANNSVYTSGSETYAQIQPPPMVVAAEISIIGESVHLQNSDENEEKSLPYEHTSQLPSVSSLRRANSTHSRHESSSSTGALSSPKPEKRQANSPLPPPPPTFPNFDSIPPANGAKSPVCKNLDDMYAKVQKTRKPKEPEAKTEETPIGEDHNYETLRKVPLKLPEVVGNGDPGYEVLKREVPNYEANSKNSSSDSKDLSGSEEPNYESMTSESLSEPNYSVLKTDSESDPNYESVAHNEPNYESVKYYDEKSGDSVVLSVLDPGYETIKGTERTDVEASCDEIVQV